MSAEKWTAGPNGFTWSTDRGVYRREVVGPCPGNAGFNNGNYNEPLFIQRSNKVNFFGMATGKRYHIGRFYPPTWQTDGNLVANPASVNFNAGRFEAIREIDDPKYIPCWSEAAHRPYDEVIDAPIGGNPILNKVGQDIFEALGGATDLIKGWGDFGQGGTTAFNVEKGLRIIMLTALVIFIYKAIRNR